MSFPAPSMPRVWLLLGDKGGDNAQLRVLATALGWPTVEKHLSYNQLYRMPNALLGASLVSLSSGRAGLTEPWPDLILASGRRAAPVARWIKARAGGHTRLVHIGRTWAPLSWFDLVVAMPQYRVPPAGNVIQATLPLNRLPPEALALRAAEWRQRVSDLPPPYISVLLGGPAMPLRFGSLEAEFLAGVANDVAQRCGSSILAISSRRTPPAVTSAFKARLQRPNLVHDWRPNDTSNAYQGFLGLADRFVVSGDSASMLAEACRTAKPVTVVPLPHDLGLRSRLDRSFDALLPSQVVDAMQRHGIAVASRDMPGLIRSLAERGHISLPDTIDAPLEPAPDDLPAILGRVRSIVIDTKQT